MHRPQAQRQARVRGLDLVYPIRGTSRENLMEFDLEKARELFESGQFASIARTVGPTASYIRQIQPRGRSLLAYRTGLHRTSSSRRAVGRFDWQHRFTGSRTSRITYSARPLEKTRGTYKRRLRGVSARSPPRQRERRPSTLRLGPSAPLSSDGGWPARAKLDGASGRGSEECVERRRPASGCISPRLGRCDGGTAR